MKMFRLLTICWLAFAVTGCSTVRDPNPDLRGKGVERACSATPMDMFSDERRASAGSIHHVLHYPLRMGLFFLPPPEKKQRAVPTHAQQDSAMRAIRGMLVAKSYVEEVAIVPAPFLGHVADGGIARIQEIAQRFDFDLVAILACTQIAHEFRNLRPLGLITFAGDQLWGGDVDQVDTFLSLTVIDPVSLKAVTFANGQADWGDTTSGIDDWRSPGYVRRGSFDRALDNLLSNFVGASYVLDPAVQRIR